VQPSPVHVLEIPPAVDTVAVYVAAGDAIVATNVPPAAGVHVPVATVTPLPPAVVCVNVPVPSTKKTWHSLAADAARDFAEATFALLA